MDVIKLAGAVQQGDSFPFVNCQFTIAANGASLRGELDDNGFPAFALPPSPRPLELEIHVTPSEPTTHAIDATFVVGQGGEITPAATTKTAAGEVRAVDPAEFVPPRTIRTPSGRLFVITFVLSRIRDATRETLDMLHVHDSFGHVPRPGFERPTTWDPQPSSISVIGDPPVQEGKIAFEQRSAAPEGEMRVLELKLPTSKRAPHYLAVFWPDAVARTSSSGPTPMLMYFHAGVAQNVDWRNPKDSYYERYNEMNLSETYPHGWDYLFFGLWRYLQYDGDPFRGGPSPFLKGIPHQVALAGKACVSILPEHSAAEEIGVLMNGDTMLTVLEEINAYMFRRRGLFRQPIVGRTALASFSSGNYLVTSFLAINQHTRFCADVLKEVYMFDLPMGVGETRGRSMNKWVQVVQSWLESGPVTDKCARAYVQEATPSLTQMAGEPRFPPSIMESQDGRITVALLPGFSWADAITRRGEKPSTGGAGYQENHQMISAVMLTDAIRRSGF